STWSSPSALEPTRLERLLARGRDPVGTGAGARANHLRQLGAVEAQRDQVVGGQPRREALLADEPRVDRPTLALAVVVRAGAAGQEAEPVAHPFELRAERVGHAGLEPADHPGAPAGQHDASLP